LKECHLNTIKLTTFYERPFDTFQLAFVFKIAIAVGLGASFWLPHYFVAADLYCPSSLYLAILISAAMACLYLATHTLRSILPEMERKTKGDVKLFMNVLDQLLTTKAFIQYGLFFAMANCFMANRFGVPQEEFSHPQYFGYITTLYFGYFLAGFVCGMAVLGIFAVAKSLLKFGLNARRTLDFTSPDNCGGTLFVGNALLIFASVTLVVGLLISTYILKTDWGDNYGIAEELKMFWIIFPYFMSFFVFVVPALTLNKSLVSYKRQEDRLLGSKLEKLMYQIDNGSNISNDDLVKKYEFNQKLRVKLHQMRTWPYGFNANFKYLLVVVVNSFAMYGSNDEIMKKLFQLFGQFV